MNIVRYRVLWIFQILHKYSTTDGNFLLFYKISNQIESNNTINIEEYRKCDYGGIQESLLGFVRFLPTVKMMDVKIVSFPFVIGYIIYWFGISINFYQRGKETREEFFTTI